MLPNPSRSWVLGSHAPINTLQAHKTDELVLLSDSQISTEVHYLQIAYKDEHDGGRKTGNHGIPTAPKSREAVLACTAANY